MGSKELVANKPHAVCIPAPAQSHIKAMLKLAKLFYHRGFHITFVNTEFNHNRFLRSQGPNCLDGLPDFRFEAIPDGIPVEGSDENATQDVALVSDALMKDLMLAPFRDLLLKLSGQDIGPPVTCVVADGFLPCAITAAEELGLPKVSFFTIAACSFMGYKQYPTLVEKGLAPLRDENCLTNGFLDKVLDWIPGMKDIRLRDLSANFRTTNRDDPVFNLSMESVHRADKASAIILHTFDALEPDVLEALSSMPKLPPIYAVGPQQLHLNQLADDPLKDMAYSLWKEETECLKWLDSKEQNSVVYVNFGSITVISHQQLVEFGWGLANSKVPFFWVIRPDLVVGESAIFPPEFVSETKERGIIASWCPQEQVLNHPSVGGFLTHSGWNSTVESLCASVPMLCWPFFSDQHTNCRYACNEWGIGMEISNDVKRVEVKKLVKELIEGEKGEKMRNKIMEWKKLAEEATAPDGSSSKNLDALVNHLSSVH